MEKKPHKIKQENLITTPWNAFPIILQPGHSVLFYLRLAHLQFYIITYKICLFSRNTLFYWYLFMYAKKILHHIAGSFLENLLSAYNQYDNSVGFALALMRCRIFEAFQRGIERILSLLMFDLDNTAFQHKKESRDHHACISHCHPKIFPV